MQTVPGFANGLSDGMPKFIQQEGFGGCAATTDTPRAACAPHIGSPHAECAPPPAVQCGASAAAARLPRIAPPIPSLWLTRADPRLARRRLYRGLTSLWGRQIPYTMMKFGAFERTVQLLYANVVPKPREECTKSEQLGVSFAAGYIAGIFCAVVSHPADNLVSKLNANKAATVGSVVSEMGMVALLTRGLPLRIIMVGTLTGLQWGIYDAFKVAVGLPTTGCVVAPLALRTRQSFALRRGSRCRPPQREDEEVSGAVRAARGAAWRGRREGSACGSFIHPILYSGRGTLLAISSARITARRANSPCVFVHACAAQSPPAPWQLIEHSRGSR